MVCLVGGKEKGKKENCGIFSSSFFHSNQTDPKLIQNFSLI
jgi:hypothetical protein